MLPAIDPSGALGMFIAEQNFGMTQSYTCYASAVLLIWHYLLTFEKEVAFFWRRRLSGPCVLFLANRYLTLVVVIWKALYMEGHIFSSPAQCVAEAYVQSLLQCSQYVVWSVFSCTRVYALQRTRRWGWAGIVLVLSLVMVVNIVVNLTSSHTYFDPSPYFGCQTWTAISLQEYQRLETAARASLVAAEMITMAITWTEMSHYRRSAHTVGQAFRKTLTLSCMFYENGRIYFVSTTLMFSISLLTSFVNSSYMANPVVLYSVEIGPIFVEPIIGILVSRFLISLQEAVSAGARHSVDTSLAEDTSGAGSVSLLHFARADVDEWIQSEGTLPSPTDNALSQGVSEDTAGRDEECTTSL